jgi:competence protein ComEA
MTDPVLQRSQREAPRPGSELSDERAHDYDEFEVLDSASRVVPRRTRVRIGVGAAIVLVIAALVVTVIVSALAPHGKSRVVAPSASSVALTPGKSSSSTSPSVIFVHVLGAVRAPGLYELHGGSRVIDAVSAAGGFLENAEQSGVNLARPVTDGEQLIVPIIGQAPRPPLQGDATTSSPQLVNLNTATETDLETLPRIGPALAGRILAWREQNGRFASVEDLLNVTGVGDKTFDGLKDLVTV